MSADHQSEAQQTKASTQASPGQTSSTATAPTRGAQLKRQASMAGDFAAQEAALAPADPVQRHGGESKAGVHSAAAHGISGSGGSMPFASQIQQSFGGYDLSNVQAHTDSAATQGASAMGADAYATGNHVVFNGAPDLHTAAHEAAHVVQQQAGVQLSGGVGTVGDPYEQHADAVADAVVAGKSAEGLLGKGAGGGGAGGVQMRKSSEKREERAARRKSEKGITGGATTVDEFAQQDQNGGKAIGKDDVNEAHASNDRESAMSLEEHKAAFGMPGKAPTIPGRDSRQMLAAIAAGTVPRYLARVGPADGFSGAFTRGTAGPFVFATEPADLRGCLPIEAMLKVGWTSEWIVKSAERGGGSVAIAVCVFDTSVAVDKKKKEKVPGTSYDMMKNADGSGDKTVSTIAPMEWDQLAEKAQNDSGFLDQASAQSIQPEELPAIFAILKATPVKGAPQTNDPNLAKKCSQVRTLMSIVFSANELYSGMGATVAETGDVGAREVMLENNDTGFEINSDNSQIIDIGSYTTEEAENTLSALGVWTKSK